MRRSLLSCLLALLPSCTADALREEDLTTPPAPEDTAAMSAVKLDATLSPWSATVPGLEPGEPPRHVALAVSKKGHRTEIVLDEVLVLTSDASELSQFLSRWSGVVLSSLPLANLGGAESRTLYRVRIDADAADTTQLPALLDEAMGAGRTDLALSSPSLAALLTVVAREGLEHGLSVAPNILWQSGSIETRVTADAPTGACCGYTPNAFTWPQLNRGSAADIGVAEAWRLLRDAGRDGARVSVGIADGGIAYDADLPSDAVILPASFAGLRNPATCTGGSSCPWHGTGVAQVVGGRIDNGIGGAGIAGNVARMTLLASPASDFFAYLRYVADGIAPARGRGVKVLNISAGSPVDVGLWALTFGVVDGITAAVRAAGLVVVASAGNDSRDVDEEDCFLGICWEDTVWIPCELEGVICIGGLQLDSSSADPGSNWGHKRDANSVEIFAPYWVWAGSNPDNPANVARLFGGTSAAAPFITGVLALILAADPSLDANEAVDIMMATAHSGPSSGPVPRWVNAYAAVHHALGDDAPPFVSITSPLLGASYQRGTQSVSLGVTAVDPESKPMSYTWRSDRDGVLATGAYASANMLSFGRHVLTVTVSDGRYSVARSVSIDILNTAPTVSISSPLGGEISIVAGQTLELVGTSYDPNLLGSLPASGLSWRAGSVTAAAFATGYGTSRTFPAAGDQRIYLVGDDGLAKSSVSVLVHVLAPAANTPPTVSFKKPTLNVDRYADQSDALGWAIIETVDGGGVDLEDGTLPAGSLRYYVRRQITSQIYTSWTEIQPGPHGFYVQGTSDTTYQVKLEGTDEDGAASVPVYRTVIVRLFI